MKLTIYKDETFAEPREVREVPRMKIPYRTAEAVAVLLEDLDFDNIDGSQLLRLVVKNTKLVTAVVQATFALPAEDLPFVDVMEMAELVKELIGYVLDKMAELGIGAEETDPNEQTPATTG